MIYIDRVRFEDVDYARTPFYGRYFSWVDRAFEHTLNQHGICYSQMVGRRRIGLPIIDTACRYFAPLALDDDFAVDIRVADLTRKGLTSQFRFRRLADDITTAEGHVRRRFVNMDQFRGTDLPDDVYARFQQLAIAMGEYECSRGAAVS